NRIELRLETSGEVPDPLTFTIEDPARIAIDLRDTGLGLKARRKDVGIGALDTILAAEANGRTRIVLNLDAMVGYDTSVDGNSVVITLNGSAGDGAGSSPSAVMAGSSGPSAGNGRAIDTIDFRRTETGAGRVSVNLSDVGTPVDVSRSGDKVILGFTGTELPDALMKRLDVIDFATPVTTIDTVRVGDDTRILIAVNGKFTELAYQSDNIFSIEIQPVVEEADDLTAAPTLYSPDKVYEGEKLTLNFQDIETRAVLQLLADVSGRNIVVSDSVQGNVTLRLQGVPWDQALDIVLATKGLDLRENGNVIIVAPASEIASRELADLESRKEIKELEALASEYLQVNYAKAEDLAILISGAGANIGGGAGGGRNSLLSDRGSVGIDERTNTLLLQDTSDRIASIRQMVAKLDIPVRQVLIESRIVIVNDDFDRELGIRWGATFINETSDGIVTGSGSASATNSIVNDAADNLAGSGGATALPIGIPALDDRFNVNLPVANPAGRFAMAILDDDYLIDLELSALQAEGRGEVVSSPRVITANQKEANIKQGVEIPYQEAASSGATTTQFKEAVLSLTVTPQITPDDRIIMDLFVTKDSVGQIVSDARGGAVPSIDTREVTTQVLVNNGQTVVLGGIYETEQGETVTKVPFLGDIPLLGALFTSKRITTQKSELLIFVTPKILKEGSSIY
ncbi:MAG: type IV pilus secretin PilQ, partial [Gammaproteobacteria bacterium]|nr:type IV pilus secretin PilQ [Gammaproteobacteria bacterium]